MRKIVILVARPEYQSVKQFIVKGYQYVFVNQCCKRNGDLLILPYKDIPRTDKDKRKTKVV